MTIVAVPGIKKCMSRQPAAQPLQIMHSDVTELDVFLRQPNRLCEGFKEKRLKHLPLHIAAWLSPAGLVA